MAGKPKDRGSSFGKFLLGEFITGTSLFKLFVHYQYVYGLTLTNSVFLLIKCARVEIGRVNNTNGQHQWMEDNGGERERSASGDMRWDWHTFVFIL